MAARLHTRGPTVQLTKDERQKWRQNEDVLRILFEDIAPAFKERNGGYTRIVKMNQRQGDAAQRAILEWVDFTPPAPAAEETTPGAEAKTPEPAKEAKAKKAEPGLMLAGSQEHFKARSQERAFLFKIGNIEHRIKSGAEARAIQTQAQMPGVLQIRSV